MPFTFSHPAIIFPLIRNNRLKLSSTGLIIGSMTPDFEYFLRMKVQSIYSHTFIGIFWFDLPLGLILCFIFHDIVRNSLFENSPTILKQRVSKYKSFQWNEYFSSKWIIVSISIIIASFSHLLWDSFTHETGFFVERSSFLKGSLNLYSLTIPIYKTIQHASSLIGGMVIVFAFFTIEKSNVNVNKINFKYWLMIASIMLLIISLRFRVGLQIHQYGNLIVTIISAGLIALILTPLILKKIEF